MIIDWIYFILLALFLYRGYRKGIILALFSIIALLAGIVAALKLSTTLTHFLFEQDPEIAKWMPFVVYVLVFIVVAWLVRLVARVLQKTVEMVALGWLNRLGGMLLYGFLITLVYSVFLWLLTQMGLLSPKIITHSKTYSFLESFAPLIIDFIGRLIPVAKNGFEELGHFFEGINKHLSKLTGSVS